MQDFTSYLSHNALRLARKWMTTKQMRGKKEFWNCINISRSRLACIHLNSYIWRKKTTQRIIIIERNAAYKDNDIKSDHFHFVFCCCEHHVNSMLRTLRYIHTVISVDAAESNGSTANRMIQAHTKSHVLLRMEKKEQHENNICLGQRGCEVDLQRIKMETHAFTLKPFIFSSIKNNYHYNHLSCDRTPIGHSATYTQNI